MKIHTHTPASGPANLKKTSCNQLLASVAKLTNRVAWIVLFLFDYQ
jgi:hypothetical protein